MAHGAYAKRRIKPAGRGAKGLGVDKKPKSSSLKNQIRSVERMLRKDLPTEVRDAQVKKLEDLKRQQDLHSRLAAERKIFLRDRKIKFFERRKIERRIRRLERMQRSSADHAQNEESAQQLSKYKEDLQYVTYFPKTEKYVPLFSGGDDSEIVDRRNRLRKQIKARLIDAARSGKDLEETGSEDDGLIDLSEDDFFLSGSSSDEADADDEWTDKSTREQASSASGKAVSGMSSDERNQRQISAGVLMPPPRAHKSSNAGRGQSRFGSFSSRPSNVGHYQSRFGSSASRPFFAGRGQTRFGSSSSQNPSVQNAEMDMSGNTSNSAIAHLARGSSHSKTSQGSNLSSNSDAHKPRRKRRHRKKMK